jgi:ribonuclease J
MVVGEAFDKLFREAEGRIIVATFASLISRIQQVADMAKKYNRKLAITGRSMRDNTKMARRLGYLDVEDDIIIDISDSGNYPDSQVVIMATGSQGEPSAVMGRLASGRHNQLRVHEGDTIVFSAHPIPGNEEVVFRTINRLFQRGANVLYERVADVHVSGHASIEEMKLMINLVRPKFLIPVHGELRHLKQHGELAQQLGIPAENIAVVENGTPIDMDEHGLTIHERLPGGYVFVDGSAVGDTGWSIVRERERLAGSGFFLVVASVNNKGQVLSQPEFISQGLANMDDEDLILGAEETLTRVVEQQAGNLEDLERKIEKALSRYLYDETRKRPFIKVVLK